MDEENDKDGAVREAVGLQIKNRYFYTYIHTYIHTYMIIYVCVSLLLPLSLGNFAHLPDLDRYMRMMLLHRGPC